MSKTLRKNYMSRAVYNAIVAVSVISLLLAFVMSFFVLYKNYEREQESNLKNELNVVASLLEVQGIDVLEDYETDSRITLVNADGSVAYDNQVELNILNNHANREEIKEAFETGYGHAVRKSDTLSKTTLYEAKLLQDGSVVRVSRNEVSAFSLFRSMAVPLLLVTLVSIIMAVLMGFRVSATVTEPINKIDLEHPGDGEVYEELRPFVQRIEAQNRLISQQMAEMELSHQSQDQMRRDFTANVSHELKTPLTSISGYAELIEADLVKKKDVARFAGIIHSEAQRMITLVGDIIKLSQLDGEDVTVKKEDVDLYETCSSVLNHLTHAAERMEVTMELEGEHVVIYTASQVVEDVIYNLCDNAIKYNRHGGKVTVTVHKYIEGVELTVSDTGIGIPPEEQELVFERFYRVDKSHSKEIGGTGLGLSIVKHGVNYLNAQIQMESVPDEGTTVRVLF